jgi:PEP-CTERM motif
MYLDGAGLAPGLVLLTAYNQQGSNVRKTMLPLALLSTALVSLPAAAQDITENLNFSLSGFVDITAGSNIPPPIQLITGSITVTYDPSKSYDNDTTDIVVHSLTGITVGSPLGFTYSNGFLEFGGTQNDSDLVGRNTNDLVVAFNVTNPAAPFFPACSIPGYSCGQYTGSSAVDAAGYTQAGFNTGWFYGAKSVVSTNPLPPPSGGTGVPEPATLSLMGLGFAALALGRVRRRKLPA